MGFLRPFTEDDPEGQRRVYEQARGGQGGAAFIGENIAFVGRNLAGAKPFYQLALERVPAHPPDVLTQAHLDLAQLEMGTGQWQAAKGQLAALARTNPTAALEYKALLGRTATRCSSRWSRKPNASSGSFKAPVRLRDFGWREAEEVAAK